MATAFVRHAAPRLVQSPPGRVPGWSLQIPVFGILLLIVGLCCPVVAAADGPAVSDGLAAAAALEGAFVEVIARAEASVVAIWRDRTPPEALAERRAFGFQQRFRGMNDERPADPHDATFAPNEFGAGIVVDANGLILTNYHLVQGGPVFGRNDARSDQRLFVRLADRRGFDARILAADPRSDLAVLKIEANDLKPMTIGGTGPVRKGQLVVALGNPYAIARDGSASATWGIVSNVTRRLPHERDSTGAERYQKETLHHLGVLLQVDTRLELGTSGGALLNLKGELIGITTSLAALAGYEKSAGFAVRLDDSMVRVIETLKQGKEVEYGFLGIGPEDVQIGQRDPLFESVARRFGQWGAARVVKASPELPARGQLEVDDYILAINDDPVMSRSDLMRLIGLAGPQSKVRVHLYRPRRERDLVAEIELGKWPVTDEEGIIASSPTWPLWQGLTVDYSTARQRGLFQVESARGLFDSVLVRAVDPESPASRAGIERDDHVTHVNGRPVKNPQEFQDAVRHVEGPATLRIWSQTAGRGDYRDVVVPVR